ncbi:MAG: insulinase family protein [Alphaproteobacteria bacterium]|nr:insulinase family protein [Alphaproteobacteria bacterium]
MMRVLLALLLPLSLAQDLPPEEPPATEAAPTYDIADAQILGELTAPGPRLIALDADTRLVLVEDHRAPLVELRLSLPVGRYSPWFRDNHGEEAWAIQLYDPDGALRARADALALDVSLDVGDRSSRLAISCLEQDLDDAVALARDILANDAFDAKELKRMDQGRRISWQAQEKDPLFRMRQAAALSLFAKGDPRRVEYEAPPKVSKDLEVLAATRDTIAGLPGRVVGFGGDIDEARARELAAALLPELGAEPEDLAPVFLDLPERPHEIKEPMDNLTQVYFAYFRDGPALDDPDLAAWMVADHVLGGHFFSRLYVALRHEGGETYGAGTYGEAAPVPEGYGLWTFTRVENRDNTELKLRDAHVGFYANGITQQELDDAIGALQGSRLLELQSPAQRLDGALDELAQGLDLGFEERLLEQVGALDVKSVNRFIAEWYGEGWFTMLEVEPK